MIKNQIKLALLLVTLFMACNLYSQGFRGASSIPIMPTVNDSILIVDTVSLPDLGNYLMSSEVIRNGYDITIINCYNCGQGFTIVSVVYDTIKIGKLPVGTYHCTLYSREFTDTSIHCDQLPYRDTLTFTFTVSQYPAGISEIDDSHFAISPNPATEKLTINTSLLNVDVAILDMSGREYILPYSQRDIDISSLAAGVYCLRIQNKEGSITRRFIKE